ncbi:MAG: UpxY family transcription antiterminator [Prolixibacteraceae bacterium]|nr:UpxY family transcription antiterminator [Prolixibacteraceae bacterium]
MLLEKPNYQWFAVYCKANSEKKISERLTEKNIECYLPTRKVLKTWSDRKKWIEEPIFKSYLFVKVSYKEFFVILNTPGVVCFVSFGGKAQSIPEIQINNVRSFMIQTDHEVSLTYERIQKGVNVEVTHGSLKGVYGEVLNIYGQSRILIRVDSLSCSLYANISKEEVKILEGMKILKESVNF